MKRASIVNDRIVACLLSLFSLIYLYGSLQLRPGSIGDPGPGAMPMLISALLLITSAVNVFNTLRPESIKTNADEKESDDIAGDKSDNRVALYGIIACFIVYPILLKQLNFLLSTFISTFIMFRLLKFKNAVHSLFSALVATLLFYIVFSRLLGVVLPNGPLEQLILSIGR
ncbi:MAG: tripartite tricarboxylate transporter TctB family protein [Desulfocucumaceae bacterium]